MNREPVVLDWLPELDTGASADRNRSSE